MQGVTLAPPMPKAVVTGSNASGISTAKGVAAIPARANATQPPTRRGERSGFSAAANSGVVVVACIGMANSSTLTIGAESGAREWPRRKK